MTYLYSAYDLTIASELDCPELLPAAPGSEADVIIVLGRLPDRLEHAMHVGTHIQSGAGVCQVLIEHVARYRVTAGRKIVVAPLPGADEGDVRLFLLGTVLGIALHQLGRLPLHVGAVAIDGRAYAFGGDSGAGKSTLAAALQRRGLPLLCDDVGVVVPGEEGTVSFYPGLPRLKLWQDALDHFGIDARPLVRDQTRAEKYHLILRDGFQRQPLPLASLYTLERAGSEAKPEVAQIHRTDAIGALIANTYRRGMVRRLGDAAAHLHQCGRVAAAVAVYRFRRPWSLVRLEASVDRLLDHVGRETG